MKKSRQPTEQIMICENEIALIAGYLSSSLSIRVLRSFEKHLNGCRDCTAFLQTYKKTIEVTRVFLRPASFSNLNPSNELNLGARIPIGLIMRIRITEPTHRRQIHSFPAPKD